MWIASTTGFLSAVKAKDDTTDLFVRARVKGDLDALIAYAEADTGTAPEVIAYEVSDYPWRVRVSAATFAGFIAQQVVEIDYHNFKDAVAKVQGKPRAQVYSGVWSTLLGLERLDPEARPVQRPWWAEYGDAARTDDEDQWLPQFSDDADQRDDDDWYDVDEWLARKSLHDLTDAEWLALDREDQS